MDSESILSSLLPLENKMISKVAPVVTNQILPGLAHGVTSTLASLGIDKLLSGNGINDKLKIYLL